MANILKGYLTLSILGLLLISVISLIGSNSFLSEPKDNIKCLEFKMKYAFINCDLLDSVGEQELSDLIEEYSKKDVLNNGDIIESNIYLEKTEENLSSVNKHTEETNSNIDYSIQNNNYITVDDLKASFIAV